MRLKLELFVRCLGLTLIAAGILLGLEIAAGWLQPVPDLGAFRRSIERVVPGGERIPEDVFPWSAFDESLTRAFVLKLLTRGAAPVALGLFLLRFARGIAALSCPGEAPVAHAPHTMAGPSATATEAVQDREDPDRKYAPPGYLS